MRDSHYQFKIKKKRIFGFFALAVGLSIALLFAEITIRLLAPQSYMMPRYQYSLRYGHELPAGSVMKARLPGRWEFRYSINEYGYRGDPIRISNRFERPNIVVLGDSYTMGAGVNDNETYSAVMGEALSPCFNVINLGVGGYGLTHEIRRFYEFGLLYQPEIVVLQFYHNDPSDNFTDRITQVENGQFRFQTTSQTTGWLKDWLAQSVLQYSQTYNFVRNAIYRLVRERRLSIVGTANAAWEPADPEGREQVFYNELLTAFAADLASRDVQLVVIAVNRSLKRFPEIRERIFELDREGSVEYLETSDWLKALTDYGSPEGHSWGAKAHRVIGTHLAQAIEGGSAEQGSGGDGTGCRASIAGAP